MTANRLLILYSAVLTVAFGLGVGSTAVTAAGSNSTTFDTINVKRINVREDDGTLRLSISNTSRAPGLILRGKEQPHPSGRKEAGLLFFNEEGTENGGLSWGGRRVDGKVQSGGLLAFDQFEQDQVIQIGHQENNGRRSASLVINDRPSEPLALDLAKRIQAMPAGPARDAELKRVREDGTFGRQRLFVGKTTDRSSAVLLSDAQGRARLLMKVSPEGSASIDFLDESGKVVRSLSEKTS
jgi:hypothetical protein